MKNNKTYIGDSVYADYECDQVVLTTENGLGATNSIYLEPEVIQNLLNFIEKCYGVKITAKKIKQLEEEI